MSFGDKLGQLRSPVKAPPSPIQDTHVHFLFSAYTSLHTLYCPRYKHKHTHAGAVQCVPGVSWRFNGASGLE